MTMIPDALSFECISKRYDKITFTSPTRGKFPFASAFALRYVFAYMFAHLLEIIEPISHFLAKHKEMRGGSRLA